MTDGGQSDATTSIGSRDLTRWPTAFGRRLAGGHARTASAIGPQPAFVLSVSIGTTIAVVATFLGTRVYDAVADRNGVERLDVPALRRARSLRSPALNAGAAAIARVFGPIGMPIIALTGAVLLSSRRHDASPAILLASAGAGSLLMTEVGKDLIRRHRPPRRDAIPPFEHSPSFPSGHTLNATTIAGILAYLIMLRQQGTAAQTITATVAVTTIASVGLSRVLLGAHWLSDVIMGWVAGAGWLSAVITSDRLRMTIPRRDGQPTSSASRTVTPGL